jgi:hypothetical protein
MKLLKCCWLQWKMDLAAQKQTYVRCTKRRWHRGPHQFA